MTTTTQRTARIAAATVAALAIAVPIAEPFPSKSEAAYAADRIIVRGRPGPPSARLREGLAAHGLSLGARIPHTRLFAVRTNGRTPAAAIEAFADTVLVDETTPNYVRRASYVPNDPYYASSEPYLATIRLPQAWDVSRGSSDVVIAVVDTGVTAVADLAAQLLPGRNFVQDDKVEVSRSTARRVGKPRHAHTCGSRDVYVTKHTKAST